ncbi:MAG TPA: DUF1071 domain-containing protein [Candidatus Saccharimonadales bacterium]|nr:DUF1071 domain-containing protein [Candidatus Saccharimonadales bacterium]
MSLFKDLYHRNVNEYTQKNNGLTYLSWSYAWAQIKLIDEKASYHIHEFPMFTPVWEAIEGVTVPYLKTPEGYFVKVSVTINGQTETETLPVMDNKNVPLGTIAPVWVKKDGAAKATKEYGPTPAPTSFDINTSHKRCLVKAIALHGLGLYIYNGEDVPEVDQEALAKQKEKEETDRKEFIKMVKHLAGQDKRLATKLAGLEKALKGTKIDDFPLNAAEKAYGILNELMQQLEAQDTEKTAAHAE